MTQSSPACPVCGTSNQCQIIRSVLMSNTRLITRQTLGYGFQNPFFSRRGSWNSFPRTYQTTSVSGLAMRLAPPGKPLPGVDKWFWGSVGISAGLGLITNLGSPIWGMLSSAFLGAILGYALTVGRNWQQLKRAWKQHEAKLVQFSDSYYCKRDDVCFMPGYYSAQPEQFKAWLFQYQ